MKRTLLVIVLALASCVAQGGGGPAGNAQLEIGAMPEAAWNDSPVAVYTKTADDGGAVVLVEVFVQGEGVAIAMADEVYAYFQGWVKGQTSFVDAVLAPEEPLAISIGNQFVIEGLEFGLIGLTNGSRARFHIPSSLAYGEGGNPPAIPGGADVIFDVEVVDVEQ